LEITTGHIHPKVNKFFGWTWPVSIISLEKSIVPRKRLDKLVQDDEKEIISVRGRGMMQALDCQTGELAHNITATAFEKGLVLETSGSDDQVLKCLMPLTISYKELNKGLDILEESVDEVLNSIPDEILARNYSRIEVLV